MFTKLSDMTNKQTNQWTSGGNSLLSGVDYREMLFWETTEPIVLIVFEADYGIVGFSPFMGFIIKWKYLEF